MVYRWLIDVLPRCEEPRYPAFRPDSLSTWRSHGRPPLKQKEICMTPDDSKQDSTGESLQTQKARLLKRFARGSQRGLRPEDIGVVKVEFTMPASRLFGSGSVVIGGGGPSRSTGLTDTDADDPVY